MLFEEIKGKYEKTTKELRAAKTIVETALAGVGDDITLKECYDILVSFYGMYDEASSTFRDAVYALKTVKYSSFYGDASGYVLSGLDADIDKDKSDVMSLIDQVVKKSKATFAGKEPKSCEELIRQMISLGNKIESRLPAAEKKEFIDLLDQVYYYYAVEAQTKVNALNEKLKTDPARVYRTRAYEQEIDRIKNAEKEIFAKRCSLEEILSGNQDKRDD